MNAELRQLKDIHLPPAINMWPNTGIWISLLLLLIGIVWCNLFFWYRRNQKKYVVQFALAKLEKLQHLMIENPENINIAAEISTLLRRTALYYFPREKVAGLSGQHWLDFLNKSGNTTNFTEEAGRLLTDAPYQKESFSDLTFLFTHSRMWLMTISKKEMNATEK